MRSLESPGESFANTFRKKACRDLQQAAKLLKWFILLFAALILAHLALCACAIFRREAAEIIRLGWFPFRGVSEPFSDSIIEIAWPNFSTCNCASRCSARSW